MTAQVPIEIPAGHPSFAGHFPQFPVLPGAVLLDVALQIIQRDYGIDLTQWRITTAKFLAAVRPGDALRLEHDDLKSGLIRFTIRASHPGGAHGAADRPVASGTLSYAMPSSDQKPSDSTAAPLGAVPAGGAA